MTRFKSAEMAEFLLDIINELNHAENVALIAEGNAEGLPAESLMRAVRLVIEQQSSRLDALWLTLSPKA